MPDPAHGTTRPSDSVVRERSGNAEPYCSCPLAPRAWVPLHAQAVRPPEGQQTGGRLRADEPAGGGVGALAPLRA
ncbi:MAG TPA: hypothetical protein VGL46_12715, partial [Pseudonocardiaceae bacterium]